MPILLHISYWKRWNGHVLDFKICFAGQLPCWKMLYHVNEIYSDLIHMVGTVIQCGFYVHKFSWKICSISVCVYIPLLGIPKRKADNHHNLFYQSYFCALLEYSKTDQPRANTVIRSTCGVGARTTHKYKQYVLFTKIPETFRKQENKATFYYTYQ